MADPSWPLQQALFAALSTALAPIKIFDAVPQDEPYPYVTFDTEIVSADNPLASRRDDRLHYLAVWSTYRGQREVKEIMETIDTALNWQRLALSTGRVVNIDVVRKRTIREPDNVTYQGQVTLRIRTEH